MQNYSIVTVGSPVFYECLKEQKFEYNLQNLSSLKQVKEILKSPLIDVYVFLFFIDNLEYYKRVKTVSEDPEKSKDSWVLDEEVTKQKGKKMESIVQNVCDKDIYCYPDSTVLDTACMSKDSKINIISEKLLKEMEIEYYKKYYQSIDDESIFEQKYTNFLSKLYAFKHIIFVAFK